MIKELTIQEVKALHPMPWRYTIAPGTNNVLVLDDSGREVPMFTMLGLVVRVTQGLAQQDSQPTPKVA